MKVIVGLGNPGKEYAETRHNVGFMVVDCLAKRLGISVGKKKFLSLYEECIVNGEKVLLVKPQTYMNLSGDAVGSVMGWYKLSPADFLVVYDDLDLPVGKLRLREKGGSGGHRGMRSIIAALGTEDFPRLRIGIGNVEQKEHESVIHHVLGAFSKAEKESIGAAVITAADALETYLRDGLKTAMNKYNGR